jgi:hypothetical protein
LSGLRDDRLVADEVAVGELGALGNKGRRRGVQDDRDVVGGATHRFGTAPKARGQVRNPVLADIDGLCAGGHGCDRDRNCMSGGEPWPVDGVGDNREPLPVCQRTNAAQYIVRSSPKRRTMARGRSCFGGPLTSDSERAYGFEV